MSNNIDLSSFPLLRLDQLHQHQIEVLLQAKVELASIPQSKDDLGIYVSKLGEAIKNEIARRTIERFTRSSPEPLKAVGERTDFDRQTNPNQFRETRNDVKCDDYHDDSKKQTRNQPTSRKGTELKGRHFISSPTIGNHKPNFISRSRDAVMSLKTKKENMLNDKEIKLHKLQQDKEKRRKEAAERMRDRQARQEWFRNRLELKVKAKQEAKMKRHAAKLKLIADMERAAADATTVLIENESNTLSLEERLILGANAATRVMEENSCDVASSNSGSSLASEVDIESVCEIEFQVFQPSDDCGKFSEEYEHNYKKNQVVQGQDGSCGVVDSIHFSSLTSQISQSAEEIELQISNSDGKVREYCEPNKQRDIDSDSVQSQEGCISIHHASEDMQHDEIARKVDVNNSAQDADTALFCMEKQNGDIHASHNDIAYETKTDSPVKSQPWKPWNSVIAPNELVEQGTTTSNETKLLDIFPNFRNIFSSFMNRSSSVMSEIDYVRERECLEYQINVGNSLSALIFDDIEGTSVDKMKRFFKVKSPRNEVNSIVQDVLLSFQSGDDVWEDMSNQVGIGNCWNLLWTWSKPKINREHLLAFQKISRFNGVTCLTRKDLLKKRLEQHRSTASLMPQTFVLPQQYNSFISSFSEYQKLDLTFHPNIWIMKPVGMSRGRGITLIDDIVDVAYASPTVIQKYITNPLLYEGFKFDLRLYVLVTSFNPLEAFIYREGLARFGSRRFSTTSTNLKDLQVHLTNSSIQKEYDDDILFSHPSRMAGKHGGGNKTSLKWLLNRLQKHGIDTTSLWKEISKLCLQTLRAVDTLILNQPNSFEVFGFDVIIDSELKPWLIEVNACPSLARESLLDMEVKEALIRDTIKIVQPCEFDRSALFQICKRRLNQRKRSMRASRTDRQELERDLKQIFGDHRPRVFGEMPLEDTDFERLSPTIDK